MEELLKAAADRGMTHFTLYPTPSQDSKKIYWCARATPSTQHGFVQVVDQDPVKAASAVLEHLPKAKLRAAKKVTVAVSEPEPQPGD